MKRSLWAKKKKKKKTKKRKWSEVVSHRRNEIYYRNISNNSGDVIFLFTVGTIRYQLHWLKHLQKLSDLLSIFVLRVLSFLLDLIITSYWCIGQNSSKKLKQKETAWTSKTTVRTGPCFFPIERILKLKKSQNWEVQGFSNRTIQSDPGFKTMVKLHLFWIVIYASFRLGHFGDYQYISKYRLQIKINGFAYMMCMKYIQ